MDEEEIIVVPFTEDELDESNSIHRTYRMDFNKKRIVGMIDGLEAAQQSIFKAMQTRRFAYQIYDDQYGCDIFNKIGNTDLTEDYLDSDIPAMIEDTLVPDDMVEGVGEIVFEMISHDSVRIEVYIKTIFGDIDMEGVITDE